MPGRRNLSQHPFGVAIVLNITMTRHRSLVRRDREHLPVGRAAQKGEAGLLLSHSCSLRRQGRNPTTTLTPSLRATAVASASLLASPWDPYGSDGLFRPRFVWIHAAPESWDEKGSLLIIQPPGSHPRLRISEPPDAEPGSVFLKLPRDSTAQPGWEAVESAPGASARYPAAATPLLVVVVSGCCLLQR